MKMDTREFAEQLDKLYRLEQLTGSVSLLSDEKKAGEMFSEAMSRSAIPGLIGKRIKAYSDKIYCEVNIPLVINYNIKSDLNSAEFLIADKFGNIVKIIELTESALAIGNHKLIWDGKNNTGIACQSGEYTLIAKALDKQNLEHDIETYMEGKIVQIIFKEIGISFCVNNLIFTWDKVFDFSVSESGYI